MAGAKKVGRVLGYERSFIGEENRLIRWRKGGEGSGKHRVLL